ncbi:MAG TPA: hypothetical protein VFG02_02295, partial [Nitrospirota bacterium]|nr:hypothetical protein [Nitrospirota bacterium]
CYKRSLIIALFAGVWINLRFGSRPIGISGMILSWPSTGREDIPSIVYRSILFGYQSPGSEYCAAK